jgi:hypothetical protein
MIWVKEYLTQGEILLAACDDDIIGKTFCEGELQLVVSESFYGGEKISKENFILQIKKATIINLVGQAVIKVALDLGLIGKEGIIEIDGIPHAQIAKMI